MIGSPKGEACFFGDKINRELGKIGMCVQTGADGGAPERDFVKSLKGLIGTGDGFLNLRGIPSKFLTETNGRGIHQMSSTDLPNRVEFT
jgi:hypothetical protein